ncbi:MAG: hypothetical protein K0R51_1712 [Cytophagaceae bacterium]|jgi:hypothetical protein|nr:hypothetical protein [Cytophagaceae bacterium]
MFVIKMGFIVRWLIIIRSSDVLVREADFNNRVESEK